MTGVPDQKEKGEKMKNTLAKIISALMITITLLGFVSALSVFATIPYPPVGLTGPYLFIDPQNSVFPPPTMLNGTSFLVNVSIANFTLVAGVQFNLTWDPTLLFCNSMSDVFYSDPLITKPADLVLGPNYNINDLSPGIDNVAGIAAYAITWKNGILAKAHGYDPANITEYGDAYGIPGFNWSKGMHGVATLNFTIIQAPNSTVPILGCALHLTNDLIGDPHAVPIAHTNIDGLYENRYTITPALIYVDPQKISNVSLTPGSDFMVNVSIVNATDVSGLQFELGFNTSILQASTVTRGGFIPISVTPATQIDNISGSVSFNASLSSPLNGNGVLAVISFHVEALGGTTLHLYGVQLIDTFGQPLPYAVADGSFDNVLLAKLAIDPPLIIDPTLVPPATFMINVTIADVRGLYGYQFNLTFDPNVLVIVQFQIQDVLNETHYTSTFSSAGGFIFINVTYYSPAVPLDVDSPTPLVMVKFRVKAIGSTNLTLTDTGLVDSTGQPITHEDHNGFFQSLIVDIAVLTVSASPTAIYQGGSTNVTVIVVNQGNITESFVLNVYYNGTLLATMNVTGLAPNTNATVTVQWNTAAIPWGKYVMSAQVPPLPYETNIANNNLTDGIVKVKIPGDLNGDDVVNILDSILLANAYGSNPSSPNWNPNADLNGDGVVNILDAIILADFFGTAI
jgi:hypothetical protein